MNQDIILLMGVIILLILGSVIGWYFCERWYAKRFFVILEECKKLNAATITLWQDILKHKEKNLQDQDNTPK